MVEPAKPHLKTPQGFKKKMLAEKDNNNEHPEEWLVIGKIVAPQGLQGDLRVLPESDFPQRFLDPGPRWLRSPQPQATSQPPAAVDLTQGRYLSGQGLYVIHLAQICDRTAAENLRGFELLVPASDLPPLAEGEFHLLDLIGLEVYLAQDHSLIGTVVGLVPAGNDLLEVELKQNPGQTVLIPFVPAIVPDIDLIHRRIEITPPLGLLPKNEGTPFQSTQS